MQDFDFGKYYQHNAKQVSGGSNSQGESTWVKKLSLLGSVVIVTFFIGMITGIYYQKERFHSPTDNTNREDVTQTMNVNPDNPVEEIEEVLGAAAEGQNQQARENQNNSDRQAQNNQDESFSQVLLSDQSQYVILARSYSSYEEAHLNGLKLQKIGLPVYLTESGTRMKVYVGPITGKNEAYSMLARIKNIREFNGAILYNKE